MSLTPYQQYRSMPWTSDHDECEAGCGRTMSEKRYVEGYLGHYCSRKCLLECESGGGEDPNYERRQMGIIG